MDDGGALTCERHGTATRLSCAECSTPICPRCAIKTPVGFKCPDHATAPRGSRRAQLAKRRKVLGPLVLLALIVGGLSVRQMSFTKPATFPCPSRTAPDVGIGDRGGGVHWKELARSPLCGRIFASTAWTGAELLVWGGQNCAGAECPFDQAPRMADGAAYNPTTNKWRKMARSPLVGRDKAATVWTGKELLVWGGATQDVPQSDGAAYDPARDSWRPIAASPLAARAEPVALWTGQAMMIWGGADKADGAIYDPAADRWRLVAPTSMVARTAPAAAWTGKEVLIWSGVSTALRPNPQAFSDGAAYDPARDSWRPIAPAPIQGRFAAASVWTGQELVVWGGDVGTQDVYDDGAAYDPGTGRWRSLPPAPVAPRTGALAVWSGTEMVFWGGVGPGEPTGLPGGPRVAAGLVPLSDGAAYNPATNSWRRLERATLLGRAHAVGAWDGKGLIIWGGVVAVESTASAADGARYLP